MPKNPTGIGPAITQSGFLTKRLVGKYKDEITISQ